jgi:O-acetyl-ADP-ribose deacetylase
MMEAKINETLITLATGDITAEFTDAIVNAANEALAGGAGVDGAIHRAGGPSIMAACRKIGGCPTGQAVITPSGRLRAKFVIHTVGPIYRGGTKNEATLLQSAYRNSLILASQNNLQSISFPAISAGIYGYPKNEAASLALQVCIEFARDNTGIKIIRHILFDHQTFEIFCGEFKKLLKPLKLAT